MASTTKKQTSRKVATKKTASSKKVTDTSKDKTRRLDPPKYKSFRLHKRIKHPGQKLPNSVRLLRSGLGHLLNHKKAFLGILLIYLIMTIVLVRNFTLSSGLGDMRELLKELFSSDGSGIAHGAALFAFMLGSVGSSANEVAALYQSILFVIFSLVIIWALRQTHAKKTIRIRDAFYKGPYPLVPFLLVMTVIGLQILPMAIGSTVYSIVTTTGLAINLGEKLVWGLLFCMLALLSLYMVSSSLFALYIVTLPDMTPMRALRSARELVRYRRWSVMRKVLLLPILMLIMAAVVMIPLIMFLAPVAEPAFLILTLAGMALAHSYLYSLYRELL